MAYAQKPDFVFRRNGRVRLNRQGRQFGRLSAAETCASAVVMLDAPCSEVVWRVLATYPICQFPLHFPSRASCAITFQLESTTWKTWSLETNKGLIRYLWRSTNWIIRDVPFYINCTLLGLVLTCDAKEKLGPGDLFLLGAGGALFAAPPDWEPFRFRRLFAGRCDSEGTHRQATIEQLPQSNSWRWSDNSKNTTSSWMASFDGTKNYLTPQ